ncbi:MAG: hypothetical protein AB8H80_02295 [Planctomycetota bacterium]
MTKAPLSLLSLLTAILVFAGCKSAPPPMVDFGGTIYTRVGMRFDSGRDNLMYTTNYVGMDTYVPPGSALILEELGKKSMVLSDDLGNSYTIRYVKKHSKMPWGEWIEWNFSDAPMDMPMSLTEDERDAIAQGDVREGMSREAVLMAWGYPPKSLTADCQQGQLKYDARRFGSSGRVTINFDAEDRVEKMVGGGF